MSEKVKVKKIVEKIKDSDLDDSMKNFLIEIFKLELPHMDNEKRRTYTEEYKKIVGKYVKIPEEE